MRLQLSSSATQSDVVVGHLPPAPSRPCSAGLTYESHLWRTGGSDDEAPDTADSAAVAGGCGGHCGRLLAAGVSSVVAHPTYVGKSTLMLSGLTPDQDAVMVLGYLTIFNDPATIGWLKSTAKIPADVTVEAQTVAASPILSVNATADGPEVAQNAAEAIAEVFGDYINAARERGSRAASRSLERQLDGVSPLRLTVRRIRTTPHCSSASTTHGATQALNSWAPATGRRHGECTERWVQPRDGGPGGLLLGILAALVLAAISTRLTNSADLRDKTGIAPLAEVPAGGSVKWDRLREDRLRALANTRQPRRFAETSGHHRDRQPWWARRAGDRRRVGQVVGAAGTSDHPGLRRQRRVGACRRSWLQRCSGPQRAGSRCTERRRRGLAESPAAGSIVADRFSLVSREKIVALFNELRASADAAIVAAPSIAETTDTQLLCAAADVTILVVPRRSKAGDVTSAADALEKVHAVLLGAVLIDGTKPKHEKTKPKHENAAIRRHSEGLVESRVECYDETSPTPN